MPSGYENRIGSYATYQQGHLAALTLINTKMANTSQPKGHVVCNLNLPAFAGQTLHLSSLTAAGADATSNVTWNGVNYEQSGNGTATSDNSTIPTVQIGSDGSASIIVQDSQAVVANIGYQIGTGPAAQYNQTACQNLAASQPVPTPDVVHNGGSPSHAPSSTNVASSENRPPGRSSCLSWETMLFVLGFFFAL